jgi:hypothetical protein
MSGLGDEPNNLVAINSLRGHRALRWGRNVELSCRSEEPLDEASPFASADFPELVPEEAMEILGAGRSYNGSHPLASIRYGSDAVPNFCKDAPPQTIPGPEQKQWFFERLLKSEATWKI